MGHEQSRSMSPAPPRSHPPHPPSNNLLHLGPRRRCWRQDHFPRPHQGKLDSRAHLPNPLTSHRYRRRRYRRHCHLDEQQHIQYAM